MSPWGRCCRHDRDLCVVWGEHALTAMEAFCHDCRREYLREHGHACAACGAVNEVVSYYGHWGPPPTEPWPYTLEVQAANGVELRHYCSWCHHQQTRRFEPGDAGALVAADLDRWEAMAL